MLKFGRWLLLASCLLAGRVSAAGTINVTAQVPVTPEYAWTVERQSSVDAPSSLVAGDSLTIVGTVRRASSVPLRGQSVLVLLEQGGVTVASDTSVTDRVGEYQLRVAGDQSWRGSMTISVVALTFGHPIWLLDHQRIDWLAPALGRQPQATTWVLVDGGPAVISTVSTQGFTEGYHATIKANAYPSNGVERRTHTLVADLVARGRDSPVVDRPFGVWRWSVG